MANKADVLAMLEKIGEDEPVFLLRAQDKLAPEIVREWAYRALSEDAPVDKVRGARTIADAMEDWSITHHRKVPD